MILLVGNGPTLGPVLPEVRRLAREPGTVVIGMNALLDHTDLRVDHLCVSDFAFFDDYDGMWRYCESHPDVTFHMVRYSDVERRGIPRNMVMHRRKHYLNKPLGEWVERFLRDDASLDVPLALMSSNTLTNLALPLCFWLGQSELVLAGCDMEGSDHFYGTGGAAIAARECLPIADGLIAALRERGVVCRSLTRTKIDI